IFVRQNDEYVGLLVSGLSALSFDAYNDAAGGSTQNDNWYINIYVSTTGSATSNCRIDYVTSQVADDTWETFDAFNGTWTGTGVGCAGFNGSIPAFQAAFPAATFLAFSNPAEPTIRFNIGDTGAN